MVLQEFLMHALAVLAIAVPLYFSYYVLKHIGGAVGSTFKFVIAGLFLISMPHLFEALMFFNINILPFDFEITEHLFIIPGILLIGYAFYKLKGALR